MRLRLAERLVPPLRERNRRLLAGGYAPVFTERALDRPDMAAAIGVVRSVLTAYRPYPANNSHTAIFGTANDIALSELTPDGFLLADERTR